MRIVQFASISNTLLGDHCDYQRSWATPFIAVLPPFWRLLQCIRRYRDSKMAWPHMANALKYTGTISVTFLAAASRMSGNLSIQIHHNYIQTMV